MTALPATLEAETESETAYGGRPLAWSTVARIWMALTPAPPRDQALSDAPPVRLETAVAEGRDDPRAARDQRLTFDGEAPWTIVALDRGQPAAGRMRLRLERSS